jgi:hypothetical protein
MRSASLGLHLYIFSFRYFIVDLFSHYHKLRMIQHFRYLLRWYYDGDTMFTASACSSVLKLTGTSQCPCINPSGLSPSNR